MVAAILRLSGVMHYLNFESLKNHREPLLSVVKTNYWTATLLYILLYILITALSLPVAAPMTLIGGFLFGIIPATIYTNISVTIGATITFLIFKHYLGDTVQKKYASQLAAFNTSIEHYGAHYLLLARLTIFINFFLVNIFAGLTRIPIITFIWTTSLGIIPGSLVYAYAGSQISTINRLSDVFSVPVIAAFSILIALGLISLLMKKYYKSLIK